MQQSYTVLQVIKLKGLRKRFMYLCTEMLTLLVVTIEVLKRIVHE